MALILKDRVKETTTVVGTGTATLLGAATGYQSFAAIGNGNTTYYTIASQTATEWEVGIGTYTSSGTTLSRDTVLSSSNGGSLVNFSAGTKDVFVVQPSEKAVYTDASNIINTSGNGANTVSFTNVNASNIVMVSGTISTNAANATDITNKTYVDGLFSTGISYHAPVLVESPTALNATYNQPGGAGNGVGATLTNAGANVALSIDGVTLSNTARVLVYTQANAVQNGIYTVTNPGNSTAQWVLTRATDADTYGLADPNKLGQGDAVFVQSGNTGAGETYVCNTPGTITFGSTNITFAQISTAQIYSAGTGLSLTNTTFSIANTAVTAGAYGDAGTVATFTVNAQGQLTAASNAAINASSITLGTLANARTTASDANGASTIVSRDANGSFTANVGTFTTVNATTGNFTNISGNGVSLTDINASNITSGTISNARTTGSTSNSASTLVLRDANGSFGSNVITASLFSGDGSGINAINASNISSGTIANARTTAASANGASTIVLRDSGGSFEANTVNASAFVGNGVQITAINASNLTTGTVDNARTTASSANGASTIVLRDTNGSFSANVVNANSFSGNGVSITDINASNLTSGTVPSARISGAYSGLTGLGTVASGTWNANVISATYGGTGLANLTADNVILGNGANAVKLVAPGTSGNVLTSNGTSWISQAAASGAGTITRTDFTATASQTVFSVSYPVGLIDVYRNGVKLATTDFTATNGTSFTLATGANAGDIIQAEVFSALNLYQTITTDTFSGNGVQTTFTMSVAPANPASTLVAISGVVQAPSNYTVNSTTLTFLTAPPSGTNNISVRYLGVPGTSSVGSISFGTTGLTPNTATTGVVTVAGTLVAANGGTGLTSPGSSGNVLTSNGTAWVSSAPAGGGQYFGNAAVKAIAYNANSIGENVTVTTGNNGLSAGPITIQNTYTVTVQTGATWVIV